MFSPDLLTRSEHSTLIIDGKLYSWGGIRPNLPHVHDSVEKKSLTSFVEVFDIPSLSWSRVSTLSVPPAAAVGYSCASINDTVYYFGGNCMPFDCYHNDLFALNTTSKEWNHVLYANEKNTPMAKCGHCMIAFKSNKEDYLLIIGGLGPLPASTYMCSHAVYRPSHSMPNLCYTNETHILCVSSLPAQWTLPEVTGIPPPPISLCSVNTLPNSNRAVLFGGGVIDDNGVHRSNDVYIITYTKNQVNYAKLDYSPLDYCPKGRFAHSSTILRANGTHHLLVVGGLDDYFNTTSDCWILDIDKRNWRKIDVPDLATRRLDHSISSFPVSDNCVWIIITGGGQQHIRGTNSKIYVRGPYVTVIIELVYSNGEWSVTGMWNNELIANHSIRLTLLDKLREGTISGALVPDGTEQLRKKLGEEKKKNDKLKSDAMETSKQWAITRRGSLDAMETSQQSSLVIDGKLYNWGGGRPNMPSISALRNLTSLVDVFDIPSLSWSRVPTVGIPPIAVMAYSCASINNVIYFFGGYCQPDDSYHNSLFTLSTSSNTWNQILFHGGEVCPIKKYGHGMVSFSNDKGDYLLTIGGFGPTSTSKSSSVALYTPSPSLPTKCFTNETHILHISSLPAQWSVPMVTGTPPTPSAFFSLDILPNTSTAIMFGGQAVDHTGLHCTNNVYLVTCTKEQVDYIKLECTGGNCPMGRSQHSSTVITADNSPYLLVMGGADDYFRTLGDSWILDINMKTWKKIEIPGSAASRFDHSTTNFMISDNLFWIIVRGGYRQCNTRNNATQFVTGADTTVIVELVYSNGEWSVTGMWNNELIANHSIGLTLLDKLREGTVSSSVIRRLETEQLKKSMMGTQEENIKLQSDLLSDPATKPGSSRKRPKDESDIQFKKLKMSDDDNHDVTTQDLRIEYEECLKKFQEKEEHEKVLKKMLLAKSQELEQLRGMRADQAKSGGRDDKLEILREEVERLQNMLTEKDEELTELNMKLKEHRNAPELKDVAIQCSSIVPATDESDIQFKKRKMSDDDDHDVTTQVLKKMLLGKSKEIEQLREIKVPQIESGGRDDKLEILREEVERLQDMLIENDEEPTELKEHRNESELKDVAIQCSSIVPATDVCKIDVGVQFNYASLETDHLQGVTISSSKLFTVHGDQPQSLIWPGHGFELHFPANTCLPGEECDIMVDAVVGGDFVFPEGVEPVSTIYIISITSKLHMPSLLRIQHCVALDKASKHSRLSFYRALLKEPKPPYHFKRVKGGKFDINSEFGELQLPTFCAKVIGKDSANGKDGKESDSEANKKCSNMSEDGDPTQPEKSNSVDTSIVFYGHAFYWKEKFNQWQFKFIVVKHLDVFNEYVSSNLKDHSSDLKVCLNFEDERIKLVSDESDSPVSHEKDSPTYKGWSIKPHFDPLIIPLSHASSFGYVKGVFPPTCLVTVVGDNSVSDYTRELHCPVLLRGASFGEERGIPKIFIKRTMEERDAQYPPSVSEGLSDQIQQNPASIDTVQGGGASSQPVDVKAVISCIKEVFSDEFAELMTVVENSLQEVSAELFASRLITNGTKKKPSYEAIITDFLSGLAFKKTIPLIIQHCEKLFSVFYKLGGPFVDAGDSLKQSIIETVKEKLTINLSFD